MGIPYYSKKITGVVLAYEVWYTRATTDAMEENTYFHTPHSAVQHPSRGGKRIFAIILIVMLTGALVFGVKQFILPTQNAQEKQASPTTTPTPTDVAFPTDTPTPTTSLTPTGKVRGTATPTPAPTKGVSGATSSIDKASGLDRSAITILVRNGSGMVGAASKMADTLKELGYKVSGTGNAATFDYEDVTIQVKAASSKYTALLKKDLSSSYTVGSTSATLSNTTTADAVVIVGK